MVSAEDTSKIEPNEQVTESPNNDSSSSTSGATTSAEIDYDMLLYFPAAEYPETAAHIAAAIEKGESPVCTIDRNGADENRDESLAGIPTQDGYDRTNGQWQCVKREGLEQI
ncbi:hypothetical protein MALU111345_14645 [Marinicrinis lubricantis]